MNIATVQELANGRDDIDDALFHDILTDDASQLILTRYIQLAILMRSGHDIIIQDIVAQVNLVAWGLVNWWFFDNPTETSSILVKLNHAVTAHLFPGYFRRQQSDTTIRCSF